MKKQIVINGATLSSVTTNTKPKPNPTTMPNIIGSKNKKQDLNFLKIFEKEYISLS